MVRDFLMKIEIKRMNGGMDSRMDGRKNDWNGTVTEAGWDGHDTVTLNGQKRKIY